MSPYWTEKVSLVESRSAVKRGLLVSVVVILLDQLTKMWIVGHLSHSSPQSFLPHLDLVLVFNRGVSFGWLNSSSSLQLLALGGILALVLSFLVRQFLATKQLFPACCYGAVLGGALGNIIDRFHYGAVVDFLDFHLSKIWLPFYHAVNWHWPAFNLADSAIVCGVAGLVLFQLNETRKSCRQSSKVSSAKAPQKSSKKKR